MAFANRGSVLQKGQDPQRHPWPAYDKCAKSTVIRQGRHGIFAMMMLPRTTPSGYHTRIKSYQHHAPVCTSSRKSPTGKQNTENELLLHSFQEVRRTSQPAHSGTIPKMIVFKSCIVFSIDICWDMMSSPVVIIIIYQLKYI